MTTFPDLPDADKIAAMRDRAKTEAEQYGQTTVPAMLLQGAAWREEVVRLRALVERLNIENEAFSVANERQARCIHLTAQSLGPDYAATVDGLPKAAADVAERLSVAVKGIEIALSDPVTVHQNMLRGTIAKPTVEQIIHIYGVDALVKALSPIIVREAERDEYERKIDQMKEDFPNGI